MSNNQGQGESRHNQGQGESRQNQGQGESRHNQNAPKQELQPHPVMEQLSGVQYCVNSPPPWSQ